MHNLGLALDQPNPELADLFWAKVARGAPDACWPWMGYRRSESGYGQVVRTIGGKRHMLQANRYAYAIVHGGVPGDLDVLHSCDNPPCCNPAHLRLGTHLDNMHERTEKNRCAKSLVPTAVQDIRVRYKAGALQRELAARFGVSQDVISRVVRRKIWRQVPDAPVPVIVARR